jgi:hypothetical protein
MVGVRVTVPGAAAEPVHPELGLAASATWVVVDPVDAVPVVVGVVGGAEVGGVELPPPQAEPTSATTPTSTPASIPIRLDPARAMRADLPSPRYRSANNLCKRLQ